MAGVGAHQIPDRISRAFDSRYYDERGIEARRSDHIGPTYSASFDDVLDRPVPGLGSADQLDISHRS